MSLLSMRSDGALNRPSLNSSARAGAGVTGAVAQEATKRESNKTQKVLISRFRARLPRRTTSATTKKIHSMPKRNEKGNESRGAARFPLFPLKRNALQQGLCRHS